MKINLLRTKRGEIIFAILACCWCAGSASAQQSPQIAAPDINASKATVRRHLFSSPATGKKAVQAKNNNLVAAPNPAADSAQTTQSNPVLVASPAQNNAETNSQTDFIISAPIKTTATGGDSVLSVVSSPQTIAANESESSAANLSEAARIGSAKMRTAALSATEIYRANAGDVLDVRLLNASNRESTLYTILEGGLIDYPLAGEPLKVAGMTTEEIAELLTGKIKIFEHPEIVVTVRDFASHKVTVTGLVDRPGVKYLRREAVPLFAILAEALQQPEAVTAEITRANKLKQTIDLQKMFDDVSVQDGDVIRVIGRTNSAAQFYFIGNFVSAPGEKSFHAGITLTQAILAAGGAARDGKNKIIVSRQNAEGLLVKTEFNLKQIKNGKIPDPQIQPGDRIELSD